MPGRNTKKLRKALARALALPGAQGASPEDLELQRRLDALIEGLSDEQREHVLAELNDPEARRPGGRRLSKLAREIVALTVSTESPAVMHPDVAQVYVEDPRASASADCEDCGLDMPRVFDGCPNCGGRIGYAAYFHKRVMPLDRLRANAESARRTGHTHLAESFERMVADREREAAHVG